MSRYGKPKKTERHRRGERQQATDGNVGELRLTHTAERNGRDYVGITQTSGDRGTRQVNLRHGHVAKDARCQWPRGTPAAPAAEEPTILTPIVCLLIIN